MLEGSEGDAPEHPVLRWLLQPQLRDYMPKCHVLHLFHVLQMISAKILSHPFHTTFLLTMFNTHDNSRLSVQCSDTTCDLLKATLSFTCSWSISCREEEEEEEELPRAQTGVWGPAGVLKRLSAN